MTAQLLTDYTQTHNEKEKYRQTGSGRMLGLVVRLAKAVVAAYECYRICERGFYSSPLRYDFLVRARIEACCYYTEPSLEKIDGRR